MLNKVIKLKKKFLSQQPWDTSFVPAFDTFVAELESKGFEVL
jgi:hypothetical protein